jgi:isoleucyl-tRNA synthetase
MFAVRELVSLGREVRTAVKMRVRQPLSRADVVVGDPQLSQRLRHFTGLIAEELNVHEVRVLAPGEEAGFVKYTLKPNFKTLGPRLGKKVQACKAALAKADAGALRTELSKNGSVSLEVEGEPLALGPEEIEVAVDAAEGYAAAGNKVGVLVLALELTDALREEGLAREIVARLQQTRKDVGLSFTDKAIVRLDGDAAVISVAEKQQELLCREAMVAKLTIGAAPEGAQAKEYAIDGAVLRVWLEAEKA